VRVLLLALLLAVIPAGLARAAGTLVISGAELVTVSGERIPNGRIVIADGKIAALGPAASVPVPEGAEVRDRAGALVIPGLVDTHSHLGVFALPRVPANADGNESSGPVQSALRALDGLWPGDPAIRMALAGGVTTANVMPGSGNPVGGQTVHVKLRGRTVDEMRIDDPATAGGLKLAAGENPKRGGAEGGRAPQTRMAVAALQRDLFVRAQEYRRKRAAASDAEPAPLDLELEPVVEALEKKRTVHYHCHRADDIATALRLRQEFGFDLVLQHVTEGFELAGEIARAGVPASIIVLDSPGGKPEAGRLGFANGAALERAGVRVAIHTDDPITHSRLMLRSAAFAVRGGMSRDAALRAVTLEAARMLRLERRVGSLEVGKDADLVVLSGDPFSVYTHVLETYIEGERVFDRANPEDRRYAVGGFAAADGAGGAR
jgi:imidazolonepropionase-like amidohydrolase